jgi:hypothetical protein
MSFSKEKEDNNFSFASFFQETEQQLPFNQRPIKDVGSQRMERKRQDEASSAGNKPLWQRLPAWVP